MGRRKKIFSKKASRCARCGGATTRSFECEDCTNLEIGREAEERRGRSGDQAEPESKDAGREHTR